MYHYYEEDDDDDDDLVKLAGQWAGKGRSLPSRCASILDFYLGAGDPNSGPHTCRARALSTEASPSPVFGVLGLDYRLFAASLLRRVHDTHLLRIPNRK